MYIIRMEKMTTPLLIHITNFFPILKVIVIVQFYPWLCDLQASFCITFGKLNMSLYM